MSIAIGFPHPGMLHFCFHESLMKTINAFPPGFIKGIKPVKAGAFSLDRARNEIVRALLEETDAEWIMQIDTDMKWEPQDVQRLYQTADRKHRPVVGGLCFRIQGTNPDIGTVFVPVMFRLGPNGEKNPVVEYSGVEKVDVTGAAFIMVHRSVYERIGSDWYSWHPDQETASEDWAFSLRLREHGIPVHVDTRAKIGHSKEMVFGEDDYHVMLSRLAGLEQQGKAVEATPVEQPPANRAERRRQARQKQGKASG